MLSLLLCYIVCIHFVHRGWEKRWQEFILSYSMIFARMIDDMNHWRSYYISHRAFFWISILSLQFLMVLFLCIQKSFGLCGLRSSQKCFPNCFSKWKCCWCWVCSSSGQASLEHIYYRILIWTEFLVWSRPGIWLLIVFLHHFPSYPSYT